MNKKWINSTLNCKAYSCFEGVSSDHRIVTTKIHLCLQRNLTQTTKIMPCDCSLLNNRDIINKYTIILSNKFNALQELPETFTLNDKYENFVNAHMEATAECILTQLRAKHSFVGDISNYEKMWQNENSIPI